MTETVLPGQLVTAAVKPDALNDLVATVFTREDVKDIPTPVSYLSDSEENKLLDIRIDPSEIAAKLKQYGTSLSEGSQ